MDLKEAREVLASADAKPNFLTFEDYEKAKEALRAALAEYDNTHISENLRNELADALERIEALENELALFRSLTLS